MAKKYFTLAIREAGQWAPQFGAYDREDVEGERREYREQVDPARRVKAADMKIITTGARQREVDAGIAKLNGAA